MLLPAIQFMRRRHAHTVKGSDERRSRNYLIKSMQLETAKPKNRRNFARLSSVLPDPGLQSK